MEIPQLQGEPPRWHRGLCVLRDQPGKTQHWVKERHGRDTIQLSELQLPKKMSVLPVTPGVENLAGRRPWALWLSHGQCTFLGIHGSRSMTMSVCRSHKSAESLDKASKHLGTNLLNTFDTFVDTNKSVGLLCSTVLMKVQTTNIPWSRLVPWALAPPASPGSLLPCG